MVKEIEDLDLVPPEAAQRNARKVLDWREAHEEDVKGITHEGWVRANQIAEGEELSSDIVNKMSDFNRYREKGGLDDGFEDKPWTDPGYVSWLGWGGDRGVDWAMRMSERIRSIEETGKDTVTTLDRRYEGVENTVENRDLVAEIEGADVEGDRYVDASTYKGYINGLEFDDENWEAAVERLRETHGMIHRFMSHIASHHATGHDMADEVPFFDDQISGDAFEKFIENLEESEDFEDESFIKYSKDISEFHDTIHKVMYQTLIHDNVMHDREEQVEKVLSEELEYDSFEDCIGSHIDRGYDEDQAAGMCYDKMDMSEEDIDGKMSESVFLSQGIMPNHESLDGFGTMESDEWSRPSYSEFSQSYDLDDEFASLSNDDKRLVAAHFARVDAPNYEEATYSDLQLPHHDPSTGDVNRTAVIAARQRLQQADMSQEDLEAIDTHLTSHLREDFGEDDIERVIERNSEEEDQTAEEIENEKATSETLRQGQLVSFEQDYGRVFGRVREHLTEDKYEVEVYTPKLGGGWSSAGKQEVLSSDSVKLESKFPESMDSFFNGGSSAESKVVEENGEDDNGSEELSDEGSEEESSEKLEPSEVQQVKKNLDK